MRTWGLSQQQDELWARWRRGESLRFITRAMGKHMPSVCGFLREPGGVKRQSARGRLSTGRGQTLVAVPERI